MPRNPHHASRQGNRGRDYPVIGTKQGRLIPDGIPAKIALVVGAGASRGVSYADACDIQSPLDANFFDLLQRVEGGSEYESAVKSVITQVQRLPYGHWRSMDRAFYTLHLRGYLDDKLTGDEVHRDEDIIKEFAQCVQVLLWKAHGLANTTVAYWLRCKRPKQSSRLTATWFPSGRSNRSLKAEKSRSARGFTDSLQTSNP